ncbi:hypothetical protein MRX96_040867, partial [Rhipicephalus microplus]
KALAVNIMVENMEAVPFRSVLAPAMYAERNHSTHGISSDIFQLYKMAFRASGDESHQFLDIGCGPGDFTLNCILPTCEPCKRIVAVDSSFSMIEYAKQHYAHEKIVYDTFDIDSDVSPFKKKYGAFQRVYSFKTLHWSRDLHHCLGNIAQLLTPGGECLLYFHARTFLFESFKELSHLEPCTKYAERSKGHQPVTNFYCNLFLPLFMFSMFFLRAVPKSHNMVNRRSQEDYLYSALSSAGLVPSTAEVLVSPHSIQSENPATDGLYQIANPFGENVFSAFLVHAVKPEA